MVGGRTDQPNPWDGVARLGNVLRHLPPKQEFHLSTEDEKLDVGG